MLIPIIKDFNNGFSYFISGSTEKAKEILGPFSKSLPLIVEGQPKGVDKELLGVDILQLSWAIIKISFLFLVQAIKYIVSFQWLRDFSYFPIVMPGKSLNSVDSMLESAEFLKGAAKEKIGQAPNVLQNYLFSNQSILNSSTPLPGSYHDFRMGSFNHGKPISSWSLSFLSNDWFDPLTVPINFLSSDNLSKFSSSLAGSFQESNHTISLSHMIIMTIFICAATGFSSFFNSFIISVPLSLSNILSLRYLMIEKFLAGCVSILGIVFGEIVLMLCLLLPPPFIQITLVYLESVIPFFLGLSFIIYIIIDLIKNPINKQRQWPGEGRQETGSSLTKRFTPLSKSMLKIFSVSFVLSWSEQCCCFSFFGSLNLSSTANFLDTYVFAASNSPLVLLFSMIGFLVGSFLAFLIYNLIIAKIIFLSISGWNSACLFMSNTALFIRKSVYQPKHTNQNSGISFSPITTLSNIYRWFLNDVMRGLGKYIVNQGNKLFHDKPFYRSNKLMAENKQPNSTYTGREPNVLWPKTIFFFPVSAFRNIESFIDNKLSTVDFGTQPLDSASNKNALVVNLGSSTLYNKIDKFLLTCLMTLSFTTIPYYSFDYLVNSVFGFIPQEQLLNENSLRVNFPDYTNLLGIPLPDNNSVINTDISLYDRAHYMYGEWPNSFEGLNYQGENMWTNLRDHRHQKRTRRSTRLKFKSLKTKISTSWKEFKQNSGLSSSSRDFHNSPDPMKIQENSFNSSPTNENGNGFTSTSHDNQTDQLKATTDIAQNPATNGAQLRHYQYNSYRPNQAQLANAENLDNDNMRFRFTTLFSKWFPFTENGVKENVEKQRLNSLSEPIKPISLSTFMEVSGGEKYIKNYPTNWRKAIFEKYYQNSIYKNILFTDINHFLKGEPETQQLTTKQENELYFLRIKMAHYYDSLRFYFNIKGKGPYSPVRNTERNMATGGNLEDVIYKPRNKTDYVKLFDSPNIPIQSSGSDQNTVQKSHYNLPIPPFQFKSLTSMNYRQQFKGTLKTVKQLLAISSPSSLNPSSTSSRDGLNLNTISPNLSSNLINNNSLSNPIENHYKYDKYLFNEHQYSKSQFLHEEVPNRKSISATRPRQSTNSSEIIRSTSKTIYNMFGSNDPFYVGWDQHLRKFVLTSRILNRKSALNHQVSTHSNSSSSPNSTSKSLNDLTNEKSKSVSIYRPYTSWPFFKHQLKNLPNRPYFVLYENYLNILNKKIHSFTNINTDDIDTKSLTFLYSYLYSQGEKRYVLQLPINIYKQSMRPSNYENLFTPVSNARSSFLWPGSIKPTWEYYFW